MSNFDEFVKENFSALHESCENGNFIAKMTKDSMLAAWNEQQKKIDVTKSKASEIIEIINENFADISDQDKEIICDYIFEIQELLK